MIKTVEESSLLKSFSSVHRYSARDVADLTFLYLIALHVLRSEWRSAPFARSYANKSGGDWSHTNISGTDLRQLLSITLYHSNEYTKYLANQGSSKQLLHDLTLDKNEIRQFLHNASSGTYNDHLAARLLMSFERDLRIGVTNYKSVRRIAGDWNSSYIDNEAKQLAVTRLLQALRHRALKGDLIPELERLAKEQNLEIKNACDPETGKHCDSVPGKPKMSLLKQLVIGAGLGLGAYYLGKALAGGSSK